ncbi:MAG: flagellin [Gammaproteobacteria bacterium]|nr:flagellin [Gammaproteobacteria bacterium]MBU1968424.1 flagellin [Gammaproteobacteria bacterium]
MAQVINTNIPSLFAGSALNKSNLALQTAMQRLSSGVRINTAKDDATGMATASGYEKIMRGANVAIRTANDGISTAQINDGYHQQVYENLQRMREIAVQLGGTASGAETSALIAENARILGLASATGDIVVDTDGGTVTGSGAAAALTTAGATAALADIDTDIDAVVAARATYGGDMATFQSAINNLQVQSVNTAAAYSRVMDTDYATETTAMTKNLILQQAGTAMLAQANQVPNNVLSLLR